MLTFSLSPNPVKIVKGRGEVLDQGVELGLAEAKIGARHVVNAVKIK